MAIGILTLLFVVISLISLIGILLLFLWKEGSGKEALFYLLAVWGLLIAACSILSLPSSFILSRGVSFAFGLLAAAGELHPPGAGAHQGECHPPKPGGDHRYRYHYEGEDCGYEPRHPDGGGQRPARPGETAAGALDPLRHCGDRPHRHGGPAKGAGGAAPLKT